MVSWLIFVEAREFMKALAVEYWSVYGICGAYMKYTSSDTPAAAMKSENTASRVKTIPFVYPTPKLVFVQTITLMLPASPLSRVIGSVALCTATALLVNGFDPMVMLYWFGIDTII